MKKVLMEIVFDSDSFEEIEKNMSILLGVDTEIIAKDWNIILCEDVEEA